MLEYPNIKTFLQKGSLQIGQKNVKNTVLWTYIIEYLNVMLKKLLERFIKKN